MSLTQLGWSAQHAQQFGSLKPAEAVPARVAREERGGYIVYADRRAMRAQIAGAMRHRALLRSDLPVVGDWVAVTPRNAGSAATIVAVVPRSSLICRRAVGGAVDAQPIAANVDTLCICTSLDRDFNPRRLERYAALAYASGASPQVLLTKLDSCSDPAPYLDALAAACPGVPALLLSVVTGEGLDGLRAIVGAGVTAALVGSSGVGKSSLINALLGRRQLATNAVREHDGKGRHTTTFRELLPIPGAGVLIDTPGMRELSPVADDGALATAYDDIERLASRCRFRDCGHRSEPGCAVLGAIESGELSAGRLEGYRKQSAEQAYLDRRDDPAALAEQRARWKSLHKAARAWMKHKYR